MDFLRRLLGGEPAPPDTPSAADDRAATDVEERAREIDLLREDEERLDELTRRQLRYADYAWEPPAQGGERRADDADEGGDET